MSEKKETSIEMENADYGMKIWLDADRISLISLRIENPTEDLFILAGTIMEEIFGPDQQFYPKDHAENSRIIDIKFIEGSRPKLSEHLSRIDRILKKNPDEHDESIRASWEKIHAKLEEMRKNLRTKFGGMMTLKLAKLDISFEEHNGRITSIKLEEKTGHRWPFISYPTLTEEFALAWIGKYLEAEHNFDYYPPENGAMTLEFLDHPAPEFWPTIKRIWADHGTEFLT